MELTTITNIREIRDAIRERIKDLNLKEYSSGNYGSENEYSFLELIGEIEELLTDLSTLSRYPSKFIKVSTYAERNSIYTNLTRIETYLENPANYIPHFEALKTLLRSYNVRQFSDRQVEFENEIENVKKIKLELQQVLFESEAINENIESSNIALVEKLEKSNTNLEEIETELEKIIERRDKLIEQSETLETINVNLETINETATENLGEITESLTESKSNEKLISSFAEKVLDREKRVDDLELKTQTNIKKLEEYDTERKSILQEANELIESSKKALNYTTAEGISASFQGQYENSNNKWIFGSWIFGAIVCLTGTVCLGIWILDNIPDNIGLLIGRISLLPLPIIGAIFCDNQYTKQKNIIEDYAYKMVLSKAIVGFSEQLKKNGTDGNEEYIHYIKTALEEIHRDPLRKRDNKKSNEVKESNLKDFVEVAERIIKMTKIE